MSEIVKVSSVFKSYGDETIVFSDANMVVNEGEFVAVVGPSGSGKTTLLHMIGTIEEPDEGRIYLLGKDIQSMDDDERADFRNEHIGFIFQFHYLVPEMTVMENVLLPAILRKGKIENEDVKRANELIDYMGISDKTKSYPSQLSGGESQRVAIARALMNSPSIIIADEPTGSLDEENKFAIMELLNSLKGRITLIFATHDTSLLKYANRIYRIEHRKLIQV